MLAHRHGRVAQLLALAGLLALMLALCADSSSAQEVRGTAVEAGTARPLAGAFVSLQNQAGSPVASTLTGPDGAYVLEGPRPGRYTLQVERIGYATWTSEPFDLMTRETVTRRLTIPVQPVHLESLTVAVESRCGPREGAGEPLLQAWEEVRKALDLSLWTEEPGRIRFELRTWTRMLDPGARVVQSQESESAWKTGRSSFASSPATELAERGFVYRSEEGNHLFFGPDARVLLSDVFQELHCFSLVQGGEGHEGLVGLSFEPIDRGEVARVKGALWLDPATGELRDLEFDFVDLGIVGLPRDHRAWGRAWFRRLPPGIWVVSRWWIKTPVLRVSLRGTTLHGYREDGGEVTRLELADGSAITLGERGTLSGLITDDIGGGPLADAAVYLAGTGHVTATDAAGRFQFDLVPAGRYKLRYRHPDPRLEGLEGPMHEVEAKGGEPTSVWLDFPSEWAAEQLCATESRDAESGARGGAALLGRIREAGTRQPVPEAIVWLKAGAASEPRAVQADSTGAFLVCGAGPAGTLALQAAAEDQLSDTVSVTLPESGLVVQDLEVSALALADAADSETADAVSLRGVVRSAETGDPVTGARVRLLGADTERVTGEDGAFLMLGIPRGRYRLVTEHLGMASDTADVDLTEGSVQLALLTLDTRPVPLPALEVEIERTFANPRIEGFYQRMERGIGEFITKEDLELRDVISNFRRLPNVEIAQCTYGGGVALRVPDCWDIQLARAAAISSFVGGPCRPLIYIDGHLLFSQLQDLSGEYPGENPFSRLQKYPRGRIEGIEVYRSPAGAPAQYRMLGDACGIVLVWTGRRF
jgi:protocatechuate 3,4-dioxygenase beta subunit